MDAIGDLTKVINELTVKNNILGKIDTVCSVIKSLKNIQDPEIKPNATALNNICKQSLKPLLNTFIDLNDIKIDVDSIKSIESKLDPIKNAVGVLVKTITSLNTIKEGNEVKILDAASVVEVATNTRKMIDDSKSNINGIISSITNLNNTLNNATIPDSKSESGLIKKIEDIKNVTNKVIELINSFEVDNMADVTVKVANISAAKSQINTLANNLYKTSTNNSVATGLIPSINALNTSASNNHSINNIYNTSNKKVHNNLTEPIIAANAVCNWLKNVNIDAWSEEGIKQDLNKKNNHINQAGAIIMALANNARVFTSLDVLNNILSKRQGFSFDSIELGLLNTVKGVERILNTLNEYDKIEILKNNKSSGDPTGQKITDKVQMAASVIQTYIKALHNTNTKINKGILVDLTALNEILAGELIKTSIDVNVEPLTALCDVVGKVLGTLEGYGEETFKKLLSVSKGDNQKTNVETHVATLQTISKVIKTYADVINKDGGKKGIVADLNTLNYSLSFVQKLNGNSINKDTFDKIDNIIVTITDSMIELGVKYNKDSGNRLQKTMAGVMGGMNEGQTGVFNIISAYAQSVVNLFKEEGDLSSLVNLNINNIKPDILMTVFERLEEVIMVIIESLKRQDAASDDKRLVAMYGEEYLKNISDIMSSVNSILSSINDILDVKKNPLLNPIKLIYAKRAVKHTFEVLEDIIDLIIKSMQNLAKKLQKKKMDDITKAYETIDGIFKSLSEIVKSITTIAVSRIPLILSIPIVIIAILLINMFVVTVYLLLWSISLINFKKSVNLLNDLNKLLGNLQNFILGLVKFATTIVLLVPLIALAALAMIPIVISFTIICAGLALITGMILLVDLLFGNKVVQRSIRRFSTTIRRIIGVFLTISLLLLALILLTAMLTVTVKLTDNIVDNLLVIMWRVFLMMVTIWLLTKIIKIISIIDLLKSILIIAIINIMLLVLLATAVILKNLTEAINGIDYLAVLGFLGMFVVITLAMIIIGWLAIAAVPVLLPAAVAMIVLSVALLIIVGCLFVIAWMLNKLATIVIDGERVKEVIQQVFDTANLVIDAIFQKPKDRATEEAKDESWWQTALNWLGDSTVGKLFKALSTMIFLAQILASIYLIKWIADCLNQIQTIKLEKDSIHNGIDIIFNTADSVIEKITKYEKKDFDKAQKNLSKYEKIADLLEDIYDELKAVSYDPNITKQCVDLVDMIGKLNVSFNNVDDKKIVNAMKSYTNFLKQIDDTDIDKLKETKSVFEQMARFSESINGNFEALAETLNEKIAPLLEELKESLDTVEKNTTQVVSRPTTTSAVEKQNIFNQMQETGQTKNLTKKEIEQIVDNKYKDNIQSQYGIDEVVSKLSALIDLFQNGDAMVRTT